jgi:hypothetical protein
MCASWMGSATDAAQDVGVPAVARDERSSGPRMSTRVMRGRNYPLFGNNQNVNLDREY